VPIDVIEIKLCEGFACDDASTSSGFAARNPYYHRKNCGTAEWKVGFALVSFRFATIAGAINRPAGPSDQEPSRSQKQGGLR
jgi:hypothetical protein